MLIRQASKLLMYVIDYGKARTPCFQLFPYPFPFLPPYSVLKPLHPFSCLLAGLILIYNARILSTLNTFF